MAIAYDSSASGGTVSSSTLTFSHTCSGSNRILFVAIEGDGSSDTLTSVTYAGVAMTRINSVSSATTGNRWLYLYYLVAPATGPNNVVATVSSGSVVLGASASYTGASQTGVPDSSNIGGSSSGSSRSVSTTTVADNCWVVGHFNGAAAPTAQAGTTLRATESTYGFSTIGDSNGVVTPAGAKSLGITWTGSNGNGGMVASFKPATTTYTQGLSATATAVPTLTKVKTAVRSLTSTALAVLSLTKANITLKNLSATALAAVNLSQIRTVVKGLAVAALAVPTIVKSWIHLITLSVGSTTPTLRASYSETNEDGYISFNTGSGIIGVGQSFETSIISVDAPLDSVKFYMKKTGSPTGMGYAKLYAHSGTFGTNSVPTGSPLATSDPFDVSTLGTSPALVTFTFSGSNRVLITESTRYVLTFETAAGAPSNTPMLAFDSTPGYAGNYSEKVSGWTGYSTGDLCFYLYTATLQASAVVSITKSVSKSLSVTALAVAALSKFQTAVRAFSATATASVTLTAVKTVVKTLSVTATAVVGLATQVIAGIVTITLSTTATASVTLTKTTTFFRTLAVEAVSVVSLTKGLLTSKILEVTATAVPTLSRIATHVVALSVTAVARVKLFLDGLLSAFSRKYPGKPGSYSEKFPSNPGSYSEKYPSKPGTYEDKYPS